MSKKNKKVGNVQAALKPVITEYSHPTSGSNSGVDWVTKLIGFGSSSRKFLWYSLPFFQVWIGLLAAGHVWVDAVKLWPEWTIIHVVVMVACFVVSAEGFVRNRNRQNGKHIFGSF